MDGHPSAERRRTEPRLQADSPSLRPLTGGFGSVSGPRNPASPQTVRGSFRRPKLRGVPDFSTTGWIAFGAASAGAVLGGLASSFGSLWVSRRQVARDARIVLHEDLLPRLISMLTGGSIPTRMIDDLVTEVQRKCVLVGRTETKLADRLAEIRTEIDALIRPRSDTEGNDTSAPTPAGRPDMKELVAERRTNVEQLIDRTRQKLR